MVHKLLAIGPPDKVQAFQDQVRASHGHDGVEATLSKPAYCEVVAAGASKADAVAFLRRELGIAADDVIAFGDGENDLPMLEAAGISVAMGNANEALKRAADLVTSSSDEDGVARALARLGLIEKSLVWQWGEDANGRSSGTGEPARDDLQGREAAHR